MTEGDPSAGLGRLPGRIAETRASLPARPGRLVVLAGILVLVTAAFFGVSGAFFCGFDDFDQLHRAAFEDTREPSLIFTTLISRPSRTVRSNVCRIS